MAPLSQRLVVPNRTLDQRFAALAHANHVRVERAKLKGEIKCGSLSAQDVIRVPPPVVLTMKLFDLVCSIPGRGHVKASVAMNTCRISHSKTVGGLSDRQRIVIIDYLDAL